jgi:hypothetical protein
MTRHRKDRGFRTERVVVSYLSQLGGEAQALVEGAGKDVHQCPVRFGNQGSLTSSTPSMDQTSGEEVARQGAERRGGQNERTRGRCFSVSCVHEISRLG